MLHLWDMFDSMSLSDVLEIRVSDECYRKCESRARGICYEKANHDLIDGAISQALLRVLQRVAGSQSSTGGHKSIVERLRSSGAKVFKGVDGRTPTVAEYWMTSTE
ncbi:1-phosphatidylinositol-4,5-bisphosphate phosphodiesterase beta-2 [Gossypium australe]|uniref:1-phosphatidylinositol-4,5-bisphosphate phosphodiesterase beta-2 n=1 Tax=Gossypium australe TaxID=47621 RepID=A0A5B6X3L4_9ROSI|nr:1-phosphatidylinositol-4,5-bisphosphate phosphodiesterase beta-2 [Gossypium australe]